MQLDCLRMTCYELPLRILEFYWDRIGMLKIGKDTVPARIMLVISNTMKMAYIYRVLACTFEIVALFVTQALLVLRVDAVTIIVNNSNYNS